MASFVKFLLASALLLLSAASAAAVTGLPLNCQCDYTIVIQTSDIPDAATDGQVDVKFTDATGQSVFFSDLDTEADDFEQGSLDTFHRTGACIGKARVMELTLLSGSGWHVDYVKVTVAPQVPLLGAVFTTHSSFKVDKWLSNDDGGVSVVSSE